MYKLKVCLWQTQCLLVLFLAIAIDPGYTSTSVSDTYNNLIRKYSDSSTVLNVQQFQLLLDSIHSAINTTETNVPEICESANEEECGSVFKDCLTAKDLFAQVDVTDEKLDAKAFELACPIIVSQLDSHACQLGERSTKQISEKEKPSNREVWGLGLLFVTLISLCSLVGVSVLPFMEKAFYKQMLTVLIGLAVGSLSGSSVFHLIPQAFGLINGGAHHEYLNISLMIWGGIWVFFMTERVMKLISDARQQGTSPSKKNSKEISLDVSSPTELLPYRNHEDQPLQSPTEELPGHLVPGTIYDYQEQAIKASFGHQEKARVSHTNDLVTFEPGKDSAIATVAWMVIFGDGLHNFIDGLSIGAAFSESILTGVSISLAVLCEEFPHELGDFAVLLNAGMSMRQALLYNFLSACTCYLGLILGILLGEIEASTYIFGFAAGMFLYISLVDMVPEMNEVAEEASRLGVKNACKTLLLQNIGMGIGMLSLYSLARYQDTFSFT